MGRGSTQRETLNLRPIVSSTPLKSTNLYSFAPTPSPLQTKSLGLHFPPTRELKVTWPVGGNAVISLLAPPAQASSTYFSLPMLRGALTSLEALCLKKSQPHVQVHLFFRLSRIKDEIVLQLRSSNRSRYRRRGATSLTATLAFIQQARSENLC